VVTRETQPRTAGDIVRRYATVGGQRISYLKREPEGNGPTVLLIHGAGMRARCWVEQLRGLDSSARILALDLPGHGDSDAGPAASLERYADTVAEFVDALGSRPIVIVGHSLGGAIAIACAARRPAAVHGLVLVSTCVRLPSTESAWQWLVPFLPWPLRRALFLFAARHLLFAPRASWSAISFGMQELRACRSQTIASDVTVARSMDVTDLARTLRVPTLILCGRRDRVTPPALSESLHGLIVESRLGLVEGAGHMLPLEAPAFVNGEIVGFVATLPIRPTPPTGTAPGRASRPLARLRQILQSLRALRLGR
jgi:3-oxoadipate enol-lactonase